MKAIIVIILLLSLVACDAVTKESGEPGLQEMLSYLSGNKSFELLTIDKDYRVNLIYQDHTLKFDTIQEFLEWYGKEIREPGLQEMLDYLSGNKSFELLTIDKDYRVNLIYQDHTLKFDTIQEFLEWYENNK